MTHFLSYFVHRNKATGISRQLKKQTCVKSKCNDVFNSD